MSFLKLNAKEKKALTSLRRLAKKWPDSLMLFSWSGSLVIFKKGDDKEWYYVQESITGIHNDGGDPNIDWDNGRMT